MYKINIYQRYYRTDNTNNNFLIVFSRILCVHFAHGFVSCFLFVLEIVYTAQLPYFWFATTVPNII